MNKLSFILFIFLSLTVKADNLGFGFILGNPTAITGQWVQSKETSYQAGFSFSYDDSFLVFADRLFHMPGTFKTTEQFINELVPYVGIGGALAVTTKDRRTQDGYFDKDEGSVGLGVRVPIGIEWKNSDPNISVYFEIAPGISIFPETSAQFMGGLGLRYFFN